MSIVSQNLAKKGIQVTPIAKPSQNKGFLGGLAGAVDAVMKPASDVLVGAAKGLGSTVANIGELGAKGLDIATFQKPKTIDTEAALGELGIKNALTPTNTAQKVGFTGEQISEFFAPTGAIAKGVGLAEKGVQAAKVGKFGANIARDLGLGRKGAKLASNVVEGATNLAARSGLTGATEGVVTAAQGGDQREIARNAVLAGAVPILGAALKATKPILGATANKIESTLIKASKRDVEDGFKSGNVFKYKLGGSLEQTAEKTAKAIETRSNELKKLIANNPAKVNINELLDNVETKLATNKSASFGYNTKIKNAINTLRDEIAQLSDDGVVDLADAQQIKRSVGKLGAWQYGVRDPDATALEKAANSLYSELRLAIEKASPAKLKKLNKELSELIPIENAVTRRIPVAERNNAISLTDILTTLPAFSSPANMWLFVLNRLSKSGKVAERLADVAQKSDGRGAIGTVLFGGK